MKCVSLVYLKLYENNNLIFTLTKIPGSDVEITNSGKLVFYDHSEHFKGKLKIHFYSKEGEFLFNEEFESADRFEFSSSGETMGVQSSKGISVISLDTGKSYTNRQREFSFQSQIKTILSQLLQKET